MATVQAASKSCTKNKQGSKDLGTRHVCLKTCRSCANGILFVSPLVMRETERRRDREREREKGENARKKKRVERLECVKGF